MALYHRQTIHWDLSIGELIGFTKSPFFENKVDTVFRVIRINNDYYSFIFNHPKFNLRNKIFQFIDQENFKIQIKDGDLLELSKEDFSINGSVFFNKMEDTLDLEVVSSSYLEKGLRYFNQPLRGFKRVKLSALDINLNY
jgi:hypothetical protein